MSIEQAYVSKIEEIKQVAESLTQWENQFIFGNGSDSQPVLERNDLSDRQKAIVDRIYKERVQGLDRTASAVVNFGDPDVSALPVEGGKKTYRVAVSNKQVGPIVQYNEAVAIVGWLTTTRKSGDIKISVEVETVGGSVKFPGE